MVIWRRKAIEPSKVQKIGRGIYRRQGFGVCVGGFAIIHAGYDRFTEYLDLVIDVSLDNEAKVLKALESLPDQAAKQVQPGEVSQHAVVRIGDEILVDLMSSACGIDYEEAAKSAIIRELDGVPIPMASPPLLWRMKVGTHREKDVPDLLFLRDWAEEQGVELEPSPMTTGKGPFAEWVPSWLASLLLKLFGAKGRASLQ